MTAYSDLSAHFGRIAALSNAIGILQWDNDVMMPKGAAETRAESMALLHVMLLAGMVLSALVFGSLLREFSALHLIQIIQGVAVLTFVLNGIAMWQQEARNPALTDPKARRTSFREAWASFAGAGRAKRLLVTVGLGTAAFSMQDILLEPFGGQIFGLGVGQTTWLTAILATGTLVGSKSIYAAAKYKGV